MKKKIAQLLAPWMLVTAGFAAAAPISNPASVTLSLDAWAFIVEENDTDDYFNLGTTKLFSRQLRVKARV